MFPASHIKVNRLETENKYEKDFRENMKKEFKRNASPRRSNTGTINKVIKPTSEAPKQAKG